MLIVEENVCNTLQRSCDGLDWKSTKYDTGVAQGSITSPQFFNIFINALLRMLTVTGQNEDISHGLQIGKYQKGDNQRDENGYQFNNIGFFDDISIFADTPKGM